MPPHVDRARQGKARVPRSFTTLKRKRGKCIPFNALRLRFRLVVRLTWQDFIFSLRGLRTTDVARTCLFPRVADRCAAPAIVRAENRAGPVPALPHDSVNESLGYLRISVRNQSGIHPRRACPDWHESFRQCDLAPGNRDSAADSGVRGGDDCRGSSAQSVVVSPGKPAQRGRDRAGQAGCPDGEPGRPGRRGAAGRQHCAVSWRDRSGRRLALVWELILNTVPAGRRVDFCLDVLAAAPGCHLADLSDRAGMASSAAGRMALRIGGWDTGPTHLGSPSDHGMGHRQQPDRLALSELCMAERLR